MGNDRKFFETIEGITSEYWNNSKPFWYLVIILFVLYLLLGNIKC